MKNTENQEIENEIIEEQTTEQSAETDNMTDEPIVDTANDATQWQDRFIRLSAEFDNYRKRTLKEKMELVQNGGADVIKSILSTADDFDRALAAMQESPDREGVGLIYNNFMESLRAKGVTEIESVGKDFDVDFHEAIARIPAPEGISKGAIVDVVQKGYMLKDKVLRFAKVVVAE